MKRVRPQPETFTCEALDYLRQYTLGRIGPHHVAIAVLSRMGTIPAAGEAEAMRLMFPCLQFGFMVGIAGGIPSASADIRLGDVAVSFRRILLLEVLGFGNTYRYSIIAQEFLRQNAGLDELFYSSYDHQEGATCDTCRRDMLVIRNPRRTDELVIHFGTIASGNWVVKDAITRDQLSARFGGVLCFEMEAAGIHTRPKTQHQI
ncbi:5'-methylthioadenosine/S-adenosylhomocysteine nucleosidase family protein [Aspergillus glaucus CBS 516.65]|uniref:Uncharacterized protein n=1 Tax=Aspergillus glaucus CBS 516.65 TaxID=1160497 RepID=A0A1L9V3R5_ASPGL|nr:hypothetical protein ASPGLDRAFT_40774 [Aspergillus glaucus CBS 516.65]OJJ78472.1 hypothetical protein ASPGLDRAFT_40774 [Aspergillus glaucus CBS 516.65]